MKFTELTVYTNTLGSEIIGGIITAAGISCYSVEDPADLEALLNDNTVPYDYIEEGLLNKTEGETLVKVYISQDEQGTAQLARIKQGIEAVEGDGFYPRYNELEDDREERDDEWEEHHQSKALGHCPELFVNLEFIETVGADCGISNIRTSALGTELFGSAVLYGIGVLVFVEDFAGLYYNGIARQISSRDELAYQSRCSVDLGIETAAAVHNFGFEIG